jgi:hypothetical protein
LGLAAAALAALAAQRLGAQASADSSPFMPPPGAGLVAVPGNTPIEFRGVMSTDQGIKVNIYETARKSSRWVGLNETGNGASYVVKSADLDHDTISVVQDGRLMTLPLVKGKVAPLVGYVPGRGPAFLNGAPERAVPLNPTSEDEQKRLQAVAEEVRRRREARLEADKQADAQAGRGGQQR